MTSMDRRQFACGLLGAAVAAGLPEPLRAEDALRLTAQPASVQLVPAGYPTTAIWGYEGRVPGPLIRVPQGARIARRFLNRLPQSSSVHWHGVRLDNAMDGVPGLTQEAVAPEESFLYAFIAPDAGTYWYHSHNRSWEQMARGLYGPLIVEEAAGAPTVDRDEVLLLDDWRLTDEAQIAGDFDALHDRAHGGRIGNWITVNGEGAWSAEVGRFSRLRLRLANVANARIFTLAVQGLKGWVVALDGMPLETPQPLDRLTLAPAQRADLIVDVVAEEGGEAFLLSFERDGGFALATFAVAAAARAAPLPAATPLPANGVPALGALEGARRVTLHMAGGAMGSLRAASLEGRMTDIRDLAAAGKVWAFNGMAGMPPEPLVEAARGETVRLAMVNDTAWPHAMHLHGHHFRQLIGGGPPGPLRDTLLVERGATAEVAFVADNPGDWLLHCHMLEHSAGGMMTWLRVA